MDVVGYRNRGMRTVPRAHTWLTFGAALPSELSLHAGARAVPVGDTLARAVEALADSPPDELGRGSHVVHAIVAGAAPLPPLLVSTPDQEARLAVYLSDALFDARDPAEIERAGALDVLVVETAAGAASDHLPEVYRELFAAGATT